MNKVRFAIPYRNFIPQLQVSNREAADLFTGCLGRINDLYAIISRLYYSMKQNQQP